MPTTTSSTSSSSLVDRFPALARLGLSGGPRSIPFVQQMQWTDCGAASLTMVMAFHGKAARLAEVRDAMGIGRDGVSAKAILETADRYGLQGRAIKVDLEQLPMLPRGCILHWDGLMRRAEVPTGQCENPVDRNIALAETMGSNGTPTVILPDGSIIPGAPSAAKLEQMLNQAAAKVASK